ncbi:TetR family transcriptional regulator [Gordonia spumicola]|uniref:TetR family transcriptional regulator n=1 Tax=Gordonia spumicola TaxID=589161 RepID=A0A7I9V4V8_9ACTN|nr:TetR/AcrR family transcriptional regulator [Gordonia spumicola]GEE00448.1 TetR family transcriptional regulator [Gordonia spumicola]
MTSSTFTTARHAQLFDELLALFLAEGFAHLTLDAIAARLRCSKSTLYNLAPSKDELVRTTTIGFFRRATTTVEDSVARHDDPRERITVYLSSVGDALTVASPQWLADVAAFGPAREAYEQNTRIAALRVKELIDAGVAAGAFRDVHAAFAADLAATTMVRIQQGEVRAATGLDDAAAYRELAAIVTAGVSA